MTKAPKDQKEHQNQDAAKKMDEQANQNQSTNKSEAEKKFDEEFAKIMVDPAHEMQDGQANREFRQENVDKLKGPNNDLHVANIERVLEKNRANKDQKDQKDSNNKK